MPCNLLGVITDVSLVCLHFETSRPIQIPIKMALAELCEMFPLHRIPLGSVPTLSDLISMSVSVTVDVNTPRVSVDGPLFHTTPVKDSFRLERKRKRRRF